MFRSIGAVCHHLFGVDFLVSPQLQIYYGSLPRLAFNDGDPDGAVLEFEGYADGDVAPVFVDASLQQVELQAVAAVGVDYVVVETCLLAVAVYPAEEIEVKVDVHVFVEVIGDSGLDGEVEGLQFGVVGSGAGHGGCAAHTRSGSRPGVHVSG